MSKFKGRVHDFRRIYFPDAEIAKHYQPKKMPQGRWVAQVKNDFFHLISSAVEILGVKKPANPIVELNNGQVEGIRKLCNLWLWIRGREIHPPNSEDASAKQGIRAGLRILAEGALNNGEVVLVTPLCPNHRWDEKGIFVSAGMHPKAQGAAEELALVRKELRQAGIQNLAHTILFGDVDLSNSLQRRFTPEEIEKQLAANLRTWRNHFAAKGVTILRMTDFFSAGAWEKKQQQLLLRIKGGFLTKRVAKVARGRGHTYYAERSRQTTGTVSEAEVLDRTQDAVAAHLATNGFIKDRYPEAILLNVHGIDLQWTYNVFGEPMLCLWIIHNHQPWRDN